MVAYSPFIFRSRCLVLALALLTPLVEAAGQDKPLAVPLLAAPINATWAANYGEVWQEKGFRGFLFQGILDDLRPYPVEQARLNPAGWETGGENTGYLQSRGPREDILENPVPGNWEALRREIGAAVNRLHASGVDNNFLHLQFAPEAPWFANASWLNVAEARFTLAGQFCRDTKLRGIAFDTQSNSFLHDYRWDGYDPEAEPDALADGARRFGKRIAGAFIRACPDGEMLLLADNPETCGPLWFQFLEGVLEGADKSTGIPVCLVFSGLTDSGEPGVYKKGAEAMNQLLEARLSKSASRAWDKQGALAFSLEPVAYQGDIPTARHPLDRHVAALYAASVYGSRYVVISAPNGGWWHIPPDVATQFSGLQQGGRARVRFAPPLPRTLDAYLPRLACPSARIIGDLTINGGEATVLQSGEKTALLACSGFPEAMEWPLRAEMVSVTALVSGEKNYFAPQDGRVTVPPLSGPVLIEGAPVAEYALPASFEVQVKPFLTAGATRAELGVHLHNSLQSEVRGVLDLNTVSRYAFGANSFPLNLAPGKAASFERTLQGLSYLGTALSLTMTLTRTSGTPISRTFSFPVAPPETFRIYCDAPLSGPPLYMSSAQPGHAPLLAWCDRRGALCCYTADPCAPVWRTRLRGYYTKPLVSLRNKQEETRIAVLNEYNRIRVFTLEGRESALVLAECPSVLSMTAVKQPGTADILAAAQDNKQISLYEGGEEFVGRIETPGKIRHLLADPIVPGCFFHVSDTGASGKESLALACATVSGAVAWENPLAAPPSCPPLIHPWDSDSSVAITLADTDGRITVRNAADGTALGSYAIEDKAATAGMMYLAPDASENAFFIRRTPEGLSCTPASGNGGKAGSWNLALPGITAMTAQPGDRGIVAGTKDGVLYAVSWDGRIQWQDPRGTAAVTQLCAFVTQAPLVYNCLAAAADHSLRILEVRDDLMASVPK